MRQLVQTALLQQPKPNSPLKNPYALFLKEFVDSVHPDPYLTSVHTFVSEWLELVGSDRERRCRSDSHLYHLDNYLVPRRLTRSAPEMGLHARCRWVCGAADTQVYRVPAAPNFTRRIGRAVRPY